MAQKTGTIADFPIRYRDGAQWIILAHEAEDDGPYPHYHLGEARPLPRSSERHFPLGDQLSFVDTSLERFAAPLGDRSVPRVQRRSWNSSPSSRNITRLVLCEDHQSEG